MIEQQVNQFSAFGFNYIPQHEYKFRTYMRNYFLYSRKQFFPENTFMMNFLSNKEEIIGMRHCVLSLAANLELMNFAIYHDVNQIKTSENTLTLYYDKINDVEELKKRESPKLFSQTQLLARL